MRQAVIFLWPVAIYIIFLLTSCNSEDFIFTKALEDRIITLSMWLSFCVCISAQINKYFRSRTTKKVIYGSLWIITMSHPLFRLVASFCVEAHEGNKRLAVGYVAFWIVLYLFSKLRLDDCLQKVTNGSEEIARTGNQRMYNIDNQHKPTRIL